MGVRVVNRRVHGELLDRDGGMISDTFSAQQVGGQFPVLEAIGKTCAGPRFLEPYVFFLPNKQSKKFG
jgi:hypothetical protein